MVTTRSQIKYKHTLPRHIGLSVDSFPSRRSTDVEKPSQIDEAEVTAPDQSLKCSDLSQTAQSHETTTQASQIVAGMTPIAISDGGVVMATTET